MDDKRSSTPIGKSRRAFLTKAGLGSLPILLSLKSRTAWGFSTQNCNLSASVSKMQSVQAEQFEECRGEFPSHGSGKSFFDTKTTVAGHGRTGYFLSTHPNYHGGLPDSIFFNGVVINEKTRFNTVFGGSNSRTLSVMVKEQGTTALERNLTSLFLHSLYPGSSGELPATQLIVDSYRNATTPERLKQLDTVLKIYIDGRA